MEDITDADYVHAKRVCKNFGIKNLGEYHDLYIQNNTLLLADVFQTFEICVLKYMNLTLLVFLLQQELAWQAALKKTKVNLYLLTDIDMSLMVEKGIREGICHAIYRYAKANNKYMKDYDKNRELSYLRFCDVYNLYGWVMPQKLPLNNFKWVEETTEFNEDFIKSYNDDSDEGSFLEVDVQYPENLHNLHNDLPIFPERMKIEKVEKLVANLHDKKKEYGIC